MDKTTTLLEKQVGLYGIGKSDDWASEGQAAKVYGVGFVVRSSWQAY